MGFLKRLLGGGGEPDGTADGDAVDDTGTDGGSIADEQARDRELLLEEARRLDDDLIQRQLRYADRAWTPPAQGGSRRADDEEAAPDER